MPASTKLSHGNCFFGILYLVLRGKTRELVGVSTTLWWWPIHFMAMNKRGHILHFQHGREAQEFAPIMFPGRFHGISRTKQQTMLQKSGRKIKFRTKRVGLVMVGMLVFWCCLVVPFGVTVFGQVFWWNFKWGFEAVSKRTK